jgi:hypothetical protein
MIVHTCNPSTQKTQAGVQSQSVLKKIKQTLKKMNNQAGICSPHTDSHTKLGSGQAHILSSAKSKIWETKTD